MIEITYGRVRIRRVHVPSAIDTLHIKKLKRRQEERNRSFRLDCSISTSSFSIDFALSYL